MEKLNLIGFCDGEKIDFAGEENLILDFARRHNGKKIEVNFQEYKKNRSNEQNSLYWKILEFAEMETGNAKEDLHEFFKAKFLPKRILEIEKDGKKYNVEVQNSTTRLNTKEFSEYFKKIELFLSEIGFPPPTLTK